MGFQNECLQDRAGEQCEAQVASLSPVRSPRSCAHFLPCSTMAGVGRLALVGPAGTVGDDGAADTLYKALEMQWGWGPEITQHLRQEQRCETLRDLLHNFESDDDWKEFFRADIKQGADAAKQVARKHRGRVSQLHEQLLKTQKQAADIKAKGEEAVEFEKPLGSEILKDKHRIFWARHKITIHIKKMPGDLLISRIVKELDKRFMHVTDLMKIKGVIWERQSESKKEKGGENLYSERTPDQQDEERTEIVRNYLDVIEMYMLGCRSQEPRHSSRHLQRQKTAPQIPQTT